MSVDMSVRLLSNTDDEVVIELRIPKSGSFLDCENAIQDELNNAGKLATQKCLEDFDTDGSPIVVAGKTLTAKRTKVDKKYQSPYGVVEVDRYAYQSSYGGATEIPLEQNARIVASSTPRFARIVSFKYAESNAGQVVRDVWESHRLELSRCYIQDISAAMAEQIKAKDPYWSYARTENEPLALSVKTIALGIDGTCMLFCDEGYRQAMVGTIAFFDAAGERLHTIYVAAAPEHGKGRFLARMDEEIERLKRSYADARYIGVSDGATDYLPWLRQHTTTQVLDFWHVSEYIASAAVAIHRSKEARQQWIDDTCHWLKHQHRAAADILDELKAARGKRLGSKTRKDLAAAISYFENNLARMNYASYRKSHIPIGSGITEAACKTIVKQRLCGSGMKWKQDGADNTLTLRAIARTDGAWEAFWKRLDKFGPTKVRATASSS